MNFKKIYYVKEMYMDKEKTLNQGIMYKYGDEREANFQRSKLNPHVTELFLTMYLDKNLKVIFLKREEGDSNG